VIVKHGARQQKQTNPTKHCQAPGNNKNKIHKKSTKKKQIKEKSLQKHLATFLLFAVGKMGGSVNFAYRIDMQVHQCVRWLKFQFGFYSSPYF